MTGMTLGIIAMLAVHPADAARRPTSPTCCPALLLTGVGMGCIFAPAFSTATLGVKSSDAGIASAMVNTSQQVGGSVGTALLSTIFASAAASFVSVHAHDRRPRQRCLDPRLHDGVRVGRRAVRSRTAGRAADPSFESAPRVRSSPKPKHATTSPSAWKRHDSP